MASTVPAPHITVLGIMTEILHSVGQRPDPVMQLVAIIRLNDLHRVLEALPIPEDSRVRVAEALEDVDQILSGWKDERALLALRQDLGRFRRQLRPAPNYAAHHEF